MENSTSFAELRITSGSRSDRNLAVSVAAIDSSQDGPKGNGESEMRKV